VIGIAARMFTTLTNSVVQLSTAPGMRGRVTAILLGILMGATPLGAPLVGWVSDQYGPRWALGARCGRSGGYCRSDRGPSLSAELTHTQ
jgi:MFS family permease